MEHTNNAIDMEDIDIDIEVAQTTTTVEGSASTAAEGMANAAAVEGTPSTSTALGSAGNDKGKRKSPGRQKIKMEKIENEANLQVAFSKRRKGVFKKANELAILTGAEVASIVFSPGGKVFSYGSQNLERTLERFTTGAPRPLTFAEKLRQDAKNQRVKETNEKVAETLKKVEAMKKHGEWLDQQVSERDIKLSDIGMENKSLDELQQSAEMVKKLTKMVDKEVEIHSAIENHAAYASREGSSSGGGGGFLKFIDWRGVMPPGGFGPKN